MSCDQNPSNRQQFPVSASTSTCLPSRLSRVRVSSPAPRQKAQQTTYLREILEECTPLRLMCWRLEVVPFPRIFPTSPETEAKSP
jgi:hypothetical protein